MNYTRKKSKKDIKADKSRLNIVLIYPGFPPEEQIGGGISTFAQEAAQGLAEAGHNVIVMSRSSKENFVIEKETKNLQIFRVPGETKLTKNLKILNFKNTGSFLYSKRIKKRIEKIEKEKGLIDVIECGDWGAEATCLLKKYRNKLLIRCHTPSFISERYNPSNKPYLSKFIKLLEKHVLKNAKYIASPSESLILEIKKYTRIKGKVIIQPYPLKTKGIPHKTEYAQNFSKEKPFKILVVGRLEERKGQDVVCRAMNLLVERQYPVKLVFAGADTPTKGEKTFKLELSEILTSESQKYVSFLGHVPKNKISAIYPEFDCYIMSSRFESMGFVIFEAMRAGLPVVASNICEMPRFIQEGINGKLFKVGNFEELFEQVESLIQDPKKIENIGRTARNYILEYFRQKQPIQQMIDLYCSISAKQ